MKDINIKGKDHILTHSNDIKRTKIFHVCRSIINDSCCSHLCCISFHVCHIEGYTYCFLHIYTSTHVAIVLSSPTASHSRTASTQTFAYIPTQKKYPFLKHAENCRHSCDPVYWIYFEEFVPRAILLWLGFLHAKTWDMLWKFHFIFFLRNHFSGF